ncbi:MAG: hypothetical protein QME51_02045, partial [Planctomycetota bacterium]|nr:hypothetical protein [Planctomycetota bacterium]
MRYLFLLIIVLTILITTSCAGKVVQEVVFLKSRLPPPQKVTGTMVILDTLHFPSPVTSTANIPVVHFAMVTNQPDVVLTSLRFEQTGTLRDEDVQSIRLYLDNGDEVFDGKRDVLLSSSLLKDNICVLIVEQSISSQPQSFFIVMDIIPPSAAPARSDSPASP